jgi:hypothetical protein
VAAAVVLPELGPMKLTAILVNVVRGPIATFNDEHQRGAPWGSGEAVLKTAEERTDANLLGRLLSRGAMRLRRPLCTCVHGSAIHE